MADEPQKDEGPVEDTKAIASKIIDDVVAGYNTVATDTKKVVETVKKDEKILQDNIEKDVSFVKTNWGWIGPLVGFIVGFGLALLLLAK